jgi:hypothetical protein
LKVRVDNLQKIWATQNVEEDQQLLLFGERGYNGLLKGFRADCTQFQTIKVEQTPSTQK